MFRSLRDQGAKSRQLVTKRALKLIQQNLGGWRVSVSCQIERGLLGERVVRRMRGELWLVNNPAPAPSRASVTSETAASPPWHWTSTVGRSSSRTTTTTSSPRPWPMCPSRKRPRESVRDRHPDAAERSSRHFDRSRPHTRTTAIAPRPGAVSLVTNAPGGAPPQVGLGRYSRASCGSSRWRRPVHPGSTGGTRAGFLIVLLIELALCAGEVAQARELDDDGAEPRVPGIGCLDGTYVKVALPSAMPQFATLVGGRDFPASLAAEPGFRPQ